MVFVIRPVYVLLNGATSESGVMRRRGRMKSLETAPGSGGPDQGLTQWRNGSHAREPSAPAPNVVVVNAIPLDEEVRAE